MPKTRSSSERTTLDLSIDRPTVTLQRWSGLSSALHRFFQRLSAMPRLFGNEYRDMAISRYRHNIDRKGENKKSSKNNGVDLSVSIWRHRDIAIIGGIVDLLYGPA